MKTKNSVHLYMLMAFVGNAIFGFSFLFSKRALAVAEPFVLLAVRFTVAFCLMTLLQKLGIVKCDLKGRDIRPLLILGILQPVAYFICESYGLKYSATSFAGILIALIPIAGLFFGRVILKEHPTKLQLVFSILSVLGVIVMTAMDDMGFQWKGFVILLGAVFSGAMYTIQSRKTAETFTAFERTYVMFGVGAAVFLLLAICRIGTNWSMWTVPLTNVDFWVSILYLSCVSSIGAFMLLNKTLDVLDVARSLVFANVTTVISVLAGVLILGEQFSPIQALGICMVLAGVYGVNRFTK